jgi:P-type Cu+ transporter
MSKNLRHARLLITDMDCASCVLNIEKDLNKLEGVVEAVVNFATGTALIKFDQTKLDSEKIVERVRSMGYEVIEEAAEQKQQSLFKEAKHDRHGGFMKMNGGGEHLGHDHSAVEGHKQILKRRNRFFLSFVLSVPVLVFSFALKVEYGAYVMMLLSFVILAFPGREFFIRGIPSLIKGRPGMDTLVALGVGASFLYSSYLVLFTDIHEEYFMDVAIIASFILLGRYIEALSKGKAGSAIRKLLKYSATTAHKVSDSDVVDISIDDVQIGDFLICKPGEKIPVDGVIIEGEAAIDESMITGESMAVEKGEGDKVMGSTINGNTSFRMMAEKVGSETMLAHIIKMVQDAQMSKAPIQKLVDKVSGFFVWGVILLSIVTVLSWYLVSGDLTKAVTVMVTVLIIACPCALGLATPISIVVGSGKGASMGILLKRPEVLEKMHKLTVVCFDKTGTITKGMPEVEIYKSVEGDDETNLARALSLERISEHSLAKSVISFVQKRGDIKFHEVKKFEAVTGRGIKGEIGSLMYYLGSEKFIKDLGLDLSVIEEDLTRLYNQGHTVLILADSKHIRAYFGVKDGIKSSAREAVIQLKKMEIKPVMVTGDNERVASAIAGEAGISEIFAEVSPEDKVRVIEKLQKENEFVGMLGDGINDSPALAKADVGIAMGTGTDIAIESGDIVIVKGDLNKAVTAIELSEATLKNIKQNLFWAFLYNSIGLPIAALGFLNPMISALAMAFSSVSVVLNALRLQKFKS